MNRYVITAALCGLAVSPAGAQNVGVREMALARISRAQAIAADPIVLQALRDRNDAAQTQDEILRKDKEWISDPKSPLRKTISSNPCAQRMREMTQEDTAIVEVILMDSRGANVCVSRETSDYWQGDEPKFLKTFGEAKPVFVEDPALDASSNTIVVQLSVVVMDGKTKSGALTLSLRVAKGDAVATRQQR